MLQYSKSTAAAQAENRKQGAGKAIILQVRKENGGHCR